MKRVSLALALTVMATAFVPSPGRAGSSFEGVTCSTVGGLDRLEECVGRSAALGDRDVKVRVLLPLGYRADGAPHPVLLLLHGCCSGFDAGAALWTTPGNGNAQEVTKGTDFVIVMPSGDHHGWYTDWLDGPQWETHHLGEILPWAEGRYNVTTDREHRFVAGLSMGGYGAMAYAARNPDLFRGAATFSGAVDIMLPLAREFIEHVLNTPDQGKIWGDMTGHEVGWRGNNPTDLATNLGSLDVLYLSAGMGPPWQEEIRALTEDNQAPGQTSVIFEVGTGQMTRNLSDALAEASIEHEYHDYVLGTHIWFYWRRELQSALHRFERALASPPAAVNAFDHRSIEESFGVFGWSFAADALRAPEFLDVTGASATGVTLTGSGRTAVQTAPLFTPGQVVTLTGALEGSAVADAAGRIGFTVNLGSAHTAKQYTPQAAAAEAAALGGYWTTATVAFS